MIAKFLLGLSCVCLLAGQTHAKPFGFIALGDAPYGTPAKTFPQYLSLIKEINRQKPALVIHVGDTKSGRTSCDNAALDKQRWFLNRFQAAVLYTPGDNEWTDCHRRLAGGFDPMERLTYIRQTYFSHPQRSLGHTQIPVESQAIVMGKPFERFVENTRVSKNQVMFVQVHVVGSKNNRDRHNPAAMTEFKARNKANIAWLQNSFASAKARRQKAVVVAFQADIFAKGYPQKPLSRRSGYKGFARRLLQEAKAFGGPVLWIYGDTHRFHVWQPFPQKAPNITALEVFGAPKMHAVKIQVDQKNKPFWQFTPVYNPALAK